MGFWDWYPRTDFHELNLDWLIRLCKQLGIDFKALKATLDAYLKGLSIPSELLEALNKNKILNTAEIQNDIFFYVDRINGSDENDGKTPETAMETIDGAIQKASILFNDIRIRIISSGIHPIDFLTFSNGALHIFADADNITIESEHDIRFYNAHLNIQGIGTGFKISVTGGNRLFYLDAGDITSINTEFDCIYRLNGAWGTCAGSTFRNMYINSSFFSFSTGNVIKDKVDQTIPALRIVNSSFFNTADLTVNLSANQSGDFALIYGGYFTITPELILANNNVYAGNFTANHCNIILADSVRASLARLVNELEIGPLYNTPDLITNNIIDVTNDIGEDGWVTLYETTEFPAGNYLLHLQVRGYGTHDPRNIRITTNTGIFYGDVLFSTNSGGIYSNIMAVQRNTSPGSVKIECGNCNGTSIRAILKTIKT